MLPSFIQIHTLHSYAGALINRDQDGLAKRMPFGGVMRTRISSQCQKRHWRFFGADSGLGLSSLAPLATRSRDIFKIIAAQLSDDGVPEENAEAAAKALMDAVMQKKKEKGDPKKKKRIKEPAPEDVPSAESAADEDDPLRMKQAITLAQPEIAYLHQIAREALAVSSDTESLTDAIAERLSRKGEKENLDVMIRNAGGITGGIESALFGRFITSDLFARVDAAVHVAHSMTVHKEMSETDFCTVGDDLDSVAAAGMFDTEINSGLFYGYVCIDVPLLVSNLTGCRREDWRKADMTLAARAVETLLRLIATTTPAAKKGSTAPYARAELMLVEAGEEQPYALSASFRTPVTASPSEDMLDKAAGAIGRYLGDVKHMYGPTGNARYVMGPARVQNVIPDAKALNLQGIIDALSSSLTAESR